VPGRAESWGGYQQVDHWYFVIEELLWCGRFPFLVEDFLNWEDRQCFNGIEDDILSKLGWKPCIDIIDGLK
jgi:hypothetical protein